MISPRHLATLGVILLALPTLVPAALAVTLPSDPSSAVELVTGICPPSYTDWLEGGSITLWTGKTYTAEGYGVDGCGGNGCDDAVEGQFNNGAGTWRDFEIHEVYTYQGCSISCAVETRSGTPERHEVEGSITVDTYEGIATFRCGTPGTGSFLFEGRLYWCSKCMLGTDPDAALPYVDLGDE